MAKVFRLLATDPGPIQLEVPESLCTRVTLPVTWRPRIGQNFQQFALGGLPGVIVALGQR